MKYINRTLLRVVGILFAAFLAVLVFQAYETPNNAEELLQVIRSIQVGQTPLKTVMESLKRYGSLRQINPCDDRKCAYTISVSNSWLQHLRVAPATELNVIVSGASGVVNEIYVAYKLSRGAELTGISVIDRSCFPCYEGQQSFSISRVADSSSGRPIRAAVELTPRSTASQKQEAYGFNLNCLRKIGGCMNAHELAPSLWQ